MVFVIVDCAVYSNGNRLDERDHLLDVASARVAAQQAEDGFVWIGLHEPTEAEMAKVADALNLHPLAVEDAFVAHQRPKLELYEGRHLFMALKTLWYVDQNDAVETGEIAVFVGADFAVTVRHGAGGGLTLTRRGLEHQAGVLGHGPYAVLYSVCDRVVDDYRGVLDELQTDVDEIEYSVFSQERSKDARRIYTLKREVAEFRRAVGPLRAPLEQLAAANAPELDPRAGAFFRDVADHANQINDSVESLDGLLSSAHDAYMARISVQQNDDMRKISSWVAIAAGPTVLAGIYGMNFRHMPELEWRYGYFLVLGMMATVCLCLYLTFKRAGWL
jgi:magnesium transporter